MELTESFKIRLCELAGIMEQVNVMGKSLGWDALKGGKFYHGSRIELNVGDILTPQKNSNFKESDSSKVSITSDFDRAVHWAKQIKSDNPVYIYELAPIGKIDVWRASLADYGTKFILWEGRVDKAEIIHVHRI